MDVLSKPAEEFGNDSMVEELWAMKAMEHAEIYFNLICSVEPRTLKMTPYDDLIYTTFRQDFPDLKINIITDNDLKSTNEKPKWRTFIYKFMKIDDCSYGTLLRSDCKKEFTPDNSLLVIRVQFLAIEIARNREGLNDYVRKHFKPQIKSISNCDEQLENTSKDDKIS